MTVSQHTQYQDPGTSSPKCNAVVFNVVNYMCASPAMACQNVYCEKGLLTHENISPLYKF